MKIRLSIALITSVVGLAATSANSDDRPNGYLVPGELDVTHVIEPAPRPGDPRYETDRKIFRATRKLIDTDRWKLATTDAD